MRTLLLTTIARRGFSVLAASARRQSQTGPVRCYDGSAGAYMATGAVHDKPLMMRLGLVKAMMVIVPSLLIGAGMSKEGAAFLEENDIFVPEDDDD